ncbi:MAG: phage terminase large subunit [Lysobacteraceae bacterium]
MTNRRYPAYVTTETERRMFDDFRVFLWVIWRHLSLPPPTPVQLSIAGYLMKGPKRRIIQAFRGCGKSWITAAYVLWLLYRDVNHRIMVVSASKERADAFSIFVKRLIHEVPQLKFLEPKGGRNSNIAFDVGPAAADQSPSVKSVGITGQLTGSRADTIIPDDIEVPGNSGTEGQRMKLAELVKEFDAILKPGGQVVALGTPQCAQSIYRTLEERGYETCIWPVRFTRGLDEEGRDRYRGKLSAWVLKALDADPLCEGKTVEPDRFSDIDIAERELSYGASGFALQFMLDTSLSDADKYPLKLSDLIVMDVDKKLAPIQVVWASGKDQVIEGIPNPGLNGDRFHGPMFASRDFTEFEGSVMVVDPSGRGKDETAYAVVKMLHGLLFVRRWGGLPGGYDTSTLTALARIAQDEEVNLVLVEENFGDGMYLSLFKPVLNGVYPCRLEGFRVSGQKEVRIIEKLEPVIAGHRLIVDRQVIEKDIDPDNIMRSGTYQLAHITRDRGALKHDDRIDALAEAVGYWTEKLSRKVDDAVRRHKEKALAEELKRHMKHLMSGSMSWRPGRTRR